MKEEIGKGEESYHMLSIIHHKSNKNNQLDSSQHKDTSYY